MRRSRLLLLALLLPALGLSCRDATGPDDVRVYAIPGHLGIVNDGEAPIYTFVAAEDLLPLLDWLPQVCDDCGKVAPGATRHVDVDSIPGGSAGEMVVVFYWRATPGVSDRLVPGPIANRRIRLDPGLIN